MTFYPSPCLWSWKSAISAGLRQIKITAFHYVDVGPATLDQDGGLKTLKELGLKVSCVKLDHEMPSNCSLDGKDAGSLRNAVDHLKRALEKCQSFGAQTAYVASSRDKGRIKAFGQAMSEVAEAAAPRGMKLCVEHVPGHALPTAREALSFVEQTGHPNLYLLVDVGHTLLSKEKPWEAIEAAGARLGYVQLDDNDGKKDRHWALLDGKLTGQDLARVFGSLQKIGYQGTLGLELSEKLPSLISAYSRNRNLVLRLQEPPALAGKA